MLAGIFSRDGRSQDYLLLHVMKENKAFTIYEAVAALRSCHLHAYACEL